MEQLALQETPLFTPPLQIMLVMTVLPILPPMEA